MRCYVVVFRKFLVPGPQVGFYPLFLANVLEVRGAVFRQFSSIRCGLGPFFTSPIPVLILDLVCT
jgi:hypothetical protein